MPILTGGKEHVRQSYLAAYSSRLDPHSLHIHEFQLLKSSLHPDYFQYYLSIRNSILRLWTRNPLVAVSREEVLQIITDKRFYDLAIFAHEWLSRYGYINFGCVEVPRGRFTVAPSGSKQRLVIIIGAGVSGLSCARHLQSIFNQFSERWTKQKKEKLPRIVLLEGRNRVGGRVYSHPLRSQVEGSLPHNLANVAEMGAQIITGFDHGNPLDALIRGQLALEYHSMKDNMIIYDHDGTIVDPVKDAKIQTLFNEVLESASVHGWNSPQKAALNGKQPSALQTMDFYSKENGDFALDPHLDDHKPDAFQKFSMSLNGHSNFPPTLGGFMDTYVVHHMKRTPLGPQEMRLLNWHYANLEYANAVNVDQLSLGGWDQDQGNEFEGRHSELVGGYGQVPRALWQRPTPLDVRFNKRVTQITHNSKLEPEFTSGVRVLCDDGEKWDADYVISTLPLGVLQENQILFNPALPSWKTGAMNRLGFGVLNKVILIFEHIFWEEHRDMYGLLNLASTPNSIMAEDYTRNRGKFYLFWNCVKISGRPMLTALMAGDAARDAEHHTDEELVRDVTFRLAKMFGLPSRPIPIEVLVTRWQKDPFARGSYSYMGPWAQSGDYDAMARPVGNLFFAGEATCGTHPATVHGAFLSGLRAASDVAEAMVGAVPVPSGFNM